MSFSLERATDLLLESHRQQRLAHAYLITGPEGSGKQALVKSVISAVSGVDRTGDSTLEDLRSATTTVIMPQSKSRRITIDEIREIEHTLQMAAEPGVTKFAIVVDADRMGLEAENAFLKTLEEPPAASMLFLISAQPEMLLDTILSRCIKVSLKGPSGPVSVSDSARKLLDALNDYTLKGDVAVTPALYLLARFTELLQEEKANIKSRNDEAMKEESAAYKNKTDGEWLKTREDFYKAVTESEYLGERNRLVEFLVTWFGDALRQQNGSPHLDLPEYTKGTGQIAKQFSPGELNQKIEGIQDLRTQLTSTNANEKLVLEAGFLRVFS
ncbi:MAG: hypothetical protein HKN23_11410 [Verrucomicrobiales bacterium]|nr:hypothetical protein [Verrucomicrobiales bacterium]